MKKTAVNTTIDQFFDGIYDRINDTIIVINQKVEIDRINHFAEAVLQYSNNELARQSLGKLIQKNDFDIVRDSIRSVYQKRETHEIGLNLVAKNKEVVPVSCSFSPLYSDTGDLTCILLIARKISDLINSQNQIKDKESEMNMFVYKASHDLKSPVSSMKGIMNLVKKSDNMKDAKMYHNMIDEGITKLETVINDLMLLGRVTYDEIVFEKINIREIIDEILRSLQFADGHSDMQFKIEIPQGEEQIVTEKALFIAMMHNLIDNAVKYRQKREEPSYVHISVASQAKGIVLSVSDNGIGIEDIHQPNVLKMFYRANSITKGSGLGLYIVKMGVAKLGGSITFKSKWKEGTTFSVYLPGKMDKESFLEFEKSPA